MGCDYYKLENGYTARFSELDLVEEGGCSCLCTFPHNYEDFMKLDEFDVESMALLGAALVLSHKNKLPDQDYICLPHNLPRWVFNEIQRVIGTDNIRKELLKEMENDSNE